QTVAKFHAQPPRPPLLFLSTISVLIYTFFLNHWIGFGKRLSIFDKVLQSLVCFFSQFDLQANKALESENLAQEPSLALRSLAVLFLLSKKGAPSAYMCSF